MSDQHEWPKPGQPNNSQPEGSQWSAGDGQSTPAPDAPNPGTTPGASQAPGAPQGPADPWAQGGSGNPYVAPSSSGNPYAAPTAASAPEYPASAPAAPEYPSSGNPYAASSSGNPYAAPSSGNPYAAPSSSGDPYAAPSNQQDPYTAPSNPYATSGQQSYGAPQNPYAAPSNPYAAPSNPYAGASNPYAGAYATGYQPYAQRPKTNTLSILSIVFAFAGIIIWPIIILSSPAGAIMGHVALGKIKQTGEGGRGLALAGIIGGWAMTGLYVLIAAIVIFFSITAAQHGYSSDPYYDDGTGAFIV